MNDVEYKLKLLILASSFLYYTKFYHLLEKQASIGQNCLKLQMF